MQEKSDGTRIFLGRYGFEKTAERGFMGTDAVKRFQLFCCKEYFLMVQCKK
jgi:hypothetical protein